MESELFVKGLGTMSLILPIVEYYCYDLFLIMEITEVSCGSIVFVID